MTQEYHEIDEVLKEASLPVMDEFWQQYARLCDVYGNKLSEAIAAAREGKTNLPDQIMMVSVMLARALGAYTLSMGPRFREHIAACGVPEDKVDETVSELTRLGAMSAISTLTQFFAHEDVLQAGFMGLPGADGKTLQ